MRVLTITAVNFMSFKSLKLDLREFYGVTLINGRNGSGKSTLLEAISWAIFGKTIRKTRADDVIHSDANACEVWLEIETPNDTFEIRRRRERGSGTTLSFSSVTDGTNKGKQALLEQYLGFDYQYFTSTVLFAGSTSSFCRLTDSARKKVLEELLGFDAYAKAYVKAQKDKNTYESRLSQIKSQIFGKEQEVSNLQESLAEYTEESRIFDFRWQSNYIDFIKDIGELQEEEHTLIDEMLNNEIITTDIRDSYMQRVEKYNSQKKRYTTSLRRISQELREVVGKISAIKERVKVAKKDVIDKSDANAKQEEGICPFCGQYLPRAFEKRVYAVQPLRDELEKLESEYKEHVNKQSSLETEFDDIESKLNSLEEPDEPDYSVVSRLKVELRNNRISQSSAWVKVRKHINDSDNRFVTLISNAELKIKSALSQIDKLKSEAIDVEEYLFVAEYWMKAFHYNGIPSYLLDNLYPVINKCAVSHSEFLTDGDLKIRFRNDDGNLGLDVSYSDGGDAYDIVSTGEKTRVDLVVLLSIRDAIEFTYSSSFSQLFLDEIFNGLDESGVESAMNLLRKNFKDKQVFLITHESSLKDLADNVINVVKTNDGSFVSDICRQGVFCNR